MININTIHTIIKRIIRKKHGQFVPPSMIDEAINMASLDLYNALIKEYRETGRVPDLLRNFRKEISGAATADGTFDTCSLAIDDTGNEDIEVISIQAYDANNKLYPVRIVDDKGWTERSFEMMDIDPTTEKPYGFYVNEVEVTANEQALPENFLGIAFFNVTEDATSLKHEGLITDGQMFESKKLEDIFPGLDLAKLGDGEVPPSFINKKEKTWTSDGTGTSSDYSNAPIVVTDLSYTMEASNHYVFNGAGDGSWNLPAGSTSITVTNNTSTYFLTVSPDGSDGINPTDPYDIGPGTTVKFIWVNDLSKWIVEA